MYRKSTMIAAALSLFCTGVFAADSVTENFKTPEKFASVPAEKLIKFGTKIFHPRLIVEDKDAVTGKAIRFFTPNAAQDKEWHTQPDKKGSCSKYVISVSNRTDRKEYWESLKGRKVQQDEKYHWFCFRNCKIGQKTLFWGWKEWVIGNISCAYKEGQPNKYDVWASVKITGPSHVKGSKKADNFFLECIILTPPGAVK